MEEALVLGQLAIVLGAAVAVVVVLTRLRLPTIAGFIVAGALIGPSGARLVEDAHEIALLAEAGVTLLLFTIGLEFSLSRLRRFWRVVALGGGLQVGLTIVAAAAAAPLLGIEPSRGVFFGFLVALSSTAIVLRGLAERGETDAPHGRLIIGALLFQDLCVVPMILVLPLLAGGGGGTWSVVRALAEAAAVVVATAILARGAVPRLLHAVALTGRRDLFVLGVLFVCLGIASLTAWAGLSLALGAFLAGIVLAESQYGEQALSDILPLSDTLSSLFFLSMGMLMDARVLVERPAAVTSLVLAILLGKGLLAALAGLAMRFPLRVALLSGIGLAQVGEFSFVLAREGLGLGLINADELRTFLAASVLTMLITPLGVRLGPPLAAGAARLRGLERLLGIGTGEDARRVETLDDHVLVLGYGLGGRLLAEALQETGIPHAVVDVNAERIAQAARLGEPAHYGDVTSAEILERLRVTRARQVVVLINDPDAIRRCVATVRKLAPAVPILVRTRYVGEIPALLEAGASQVVAQELEASLEILSAVLSAAAIPGSVIGTRVRQARHGGLGVTPLAEGGAGEPAIAFEPGAAARIATFLVRGDSWIAGRDLAESSMRERTGATVMAVSREGTTMTHPEVGERFARGDVLYLIGASAALSAARDLLQSGPSDADEGNRS